MLHQSINQSIVVSCIGQQCYKYCDFIADCDGASLSSPVTSLLAYQRNYRGRDAREMERKGRGKEEKGEEGGRGGKKSKNTPSVNSCLSAYALGRIHPFSSCSFSLLFSFPFRFPFTEVQLRGLEEIVSSQAPQGVPKHRPVEKQKQL